MAYTKLTLRVEEDFVTEAKQFAKAEGTSLSKLFKTLFDERMARKQKLSRPIIPPEQLHRKPIPGISDKTDEELKEMYIKHLLNR